MHTKTLKNILYYKKSLLWCKRDTAPTTQLYIGVVYDTKCCAHNRGLEVDCWPTQKVKRAFINDHSRDVTICFSFKNTTSISDVIRWLQWGQNKSQHYSRVFRFYFLFLKTVHILETGAAAALDRNTEVFIGFIFLVQMHYSLACTWTCVELIKRAVSIIIAICIVLAIHSPIPRRIAW